MLLPSCPTWRSVDRLRATPVLHRLRRPKRFVFQQDASQLLTPAARQSGQKISEMIKTMNDQNRITEWMENKKNHAITSIIGLSG